MIKGTAAKYSAYLCAGYVVRRADVLNHIHYTRLIYIPLFAIFARRNVQIHSQS